MIYLSRSSTNSQSYGKPIPYTYRMQDDIVRIACQVNVRDVCEMDAKVWGLDG